MLMSTLFSLGGLPTHPQNPHSWRTTFSLLNDGNASMPERVKRPNPWRKMMMIMHFSPFPCYLVLRSLKHKHASQFDSVLCAYSSRHSASSTCHILSVCFISLSDCTKFYTFHIPLAELALLSRFLIRIIRLRYPVQIGSPVSHIYILPPIRRAHAIFFFHLLPSKKRESRSCAHLKYSGIKSRLILKIRDLMG